MFSPSNELLDAAKLLVASKLNGTPEWALFPRWTRDGKRMWIQSSSGSTLAWLDFDNIGCTITMSDRVGENAGKTERRPWTMVEYDREGNRV